METMGSMYSENYNDPKNEPWGIPQFTGEEDIEHSIIVE